MRILIIVPAVLLLAACNVSKDGNAVTVQYDQNEAENLASDAGNTAENIGAGISNDAQAAANAIDNQVADEPDSDNSASATNQQ